MLKTIHNYTVQYKLQSQLTPICPSLQSSPDLSAWRDSCCCSAEEIPAELLPELGPDDAVDEQVGGGVDHQENIGEESNKNTPNGESTKKRILAKFNEIKNKDLMHVENQAREVTEDECGHNHNEDERQVLLLISPSIPPPSNSKIYVDVEDGDGHKRKDAKNHQTQPIMIICDVEMICTKFCDINKNISNFILGHLALKKLWYVEDDSKEGDGKEISEQATPVRSGVGEYLVIIERMIDCYVAFCGHSDCHEDGASQGDGVERVEDVGEQEDVSICLQTKPPHGLQQHGNQVQEIKAGQHCQQLIEAALQLWPGEKEY